MNEKNELYSIVASLMQEGKGILAADESDGTAGKRLAMVNLPNQQGNRQDFRELLFTAPDIEEYLSGIILYDSTIREKTDDGLPFSDVLTARGIIPGIKVDRGTRDVVQFPNESITQGLDDLGDRCAEYYKLGARFTKWRAVFSISDMTPTDPMIEMNAAMLARYALYAQANNMVPIVEPEVIFAGDHSIEEAQRVTMRVLQKLFVALETYCVDLRGLILKSSMVLAGDKHEPQSTADEVADATLRTFHLSVPHHVGGIVFLSGGQSPKRATENLNRIAQKGPHPWPITFSYSRALEEPVLLAWQGKPENIKNAQKVLARTAQANSLASLGKYVPQENPKKEAGE